MDLRHLTWQFESITSMYVQAKLQFQAVLDQVFPEYRGIFGDLYSRVSEKTTSQIKLLVYVQAVLTAGLKKRQNSLWTPRSTIHFRK